MPENSGERYTSKDVTVEVLGFKIDNLTHFVEEGMKAFSKTIESHDVTLYGEKSTMGLVGDVDALKKEIAGVKRGLTWLSGIIIMAVFGLLWAIFTGQASIVFK